MAGISKRFPGVVALDSVAFDVMPGEVVGLVGENGAGKSTLMKILAGLHQPDAGEVRLNGRRVSIQSPARATELGLGVIHQELEIIDNMDVAGNVFLGREHTWCGPLRLIDHKKIYAQTEACLARLGVALSPRTTLDRLSTAQQQLVAIARALSMKAHILIMDEPTASLTLSDTERLFQVIRDLRYGGVTIIYISHRLAEVEALADRVFVLRDGRNAGVLSRQEISRDRMVRLMVGRDVKSDARDARHENEALLSGGREAAHAPVSGGRGVADDRARRDSRRRRTDWRGAVRACRGRSAVWSGACRGMSCSMARRWPSIPREMPSGTASISFPRIAAGAASSRP